MGNSFKVQKGGTNREQAVQGGMLLFLLGLVGGVLVHPIGYLMAFLGIVIAIAGKFASE